MNIEYIQNLRYKLQKRVRQLNSADHLTLHVKLQHFIVFLRGHPLLVAILEHLEHQFPNLDDPNDIEAGFNENTPDGLGKDEDEHAAIAWRMLKRAVASEEEHFEMNTGFGFTGGSEAEDCLDAFRAVYLEPVYEYLDEHLDDQRAILALLLRYKHRSEWFRKEQLLQLAEDGERPMADDLYEYHFDQGIDFTVEPKSASGRPDLLADQIGDDHLVADAKLFRPGAGKAYIAKAFHQIYQYCLDYNEPFGYLIVFKTCEEDLSFPLANQEQATPFLVHNNKTIFFVVVDICRHENTASKRGKLKTMEISEKELVEAITAEE